MPLELAVEGVCISFERRQVLQDVSFVARCGEAVAIVGPSGSGKSTLLNIIGSLIPPDDGSIQLGQEQVAALRGKDQERYRNRQVGFLFQEHHLLPHLSAIENVLVPTLGLAGRADAAVRGRKLLADLGLSERLADFPPTLSGGERQRVALARALINDPPLLLCDEPTGSLDQASGDVLFSLLLGLAHENGKILLAVTHNAEQAPRFDRVLSLCDGRLS